MFMAGFVPGAASSALCSVSQAAPDEKSKVLYLALTGAFGQGTKPGNGGDTCPCSRGGTQPHLL